MKTGFYIGDIKAATIEAIGDVSFFKLELMGLKCRIKYGTQDKHTQVRVELMNFLMNNTQQPWARFFQEINGKPVTFVEYGVHYSMPCLLSDVDRWGTSKQLILAAKLYKIDFVLYIPGVKPKFMNYFVDFAEEEPILVERANGDVIKYYDPKEVMPQADGPIFILRLQEDHFEAARNSYRMAAGENEIAKIIILPKNYSFEIPKTIWKIRSTSSKIVGLQFPEGLLLYSCVIADILTKYTDADMIIMGMALGCDLLVHYGHSCLVPIQDTVGIHMLYVFVNIDINLSHLIDTVRANFKKEQKLAFVSTIQFVASLQAVNRVLLAEEYSVIIPQCSPLSPGDGRFHLESIMIQNPDMPSYAYNPYSKQLTSEKYGQEVMVKTREWAGNIKIFEDVETKLIQAGKRFVKVLMSEIFAKKLAVFKTVDSWVQVACPRLSIDWGYSFSAPLLTPFELSAALNYTSFSPSQLLKGYPMDYYAYKSLGPWTNNHESYRKVKPKRAHISLK
uniref:2-(3-amino-3-carboxypropyl)histidine synthase subunit 1 n=1 Tax=Ditylenchus dipsaci TaxID=166011 RepID=A0A915CP19_9BILA